tara:strand:+ start:251 stop:511 length:261 start_codon:yes stop_codon:yes gene_type:complete
MKNTLIKMSNFDLKKYLAENKLNEQNSNKEMEDAVVQKQADKEELMSMRVNMLGIMKTFKNLGYTKEEVTKFFDNERDSKLNNTYF